MDGFRIAQGDPARLGDHQPAALAVEQGLSQLLFELANLGGQGRLRHIELLRGTRQVAGARDHPEVVEMVVVQMGHGGSACAS